MSSGEESKTQCLARAALDRPVVVSLVGQRGAVADVRTDGGEGMVGFPIDHLFAFDRPLFDRLLVAYDRGDRGVLARLWREARPVELGASE